MQYLIQFVKQLKKWKMDPLKTIFALNIYSHMFQTTILGQVASRASIELRGFSYLSC